MMSIIGVRHGIQAGSLLFVRLAFERMKPARISHCIRYLIERMISSFYVDYRPESDLVSLQRECDDDKRNIQTKPN